MALQVACLARNSSGFADAAKKEDWGMRRSLALMALLLGLVVAAVPPERLAANTGAEGHSGQDVTFRGRAVMYAAPAPGCLDCYEGWLVDAQTVLSGPAIFGRVEVITGAGGFVGCWGGHTDPGILPGDRVEVHAWLGVNEWPYIVFVCGGGADYYIRRVRALSQRLFLPAVFARRE
jgi:hypothetical protein